MYKRQDVERPLRLAVNVLGDAVQILLYFFQKTGERFSVELDARAFHIRKHRDERQLQRLHEIDEVRAGQPFEQLVGHGAVSYTHLDVYKRQPLR